MFLFNPDLGDNFIGRKKELDFTIEQFRLGQNVFLTAPRRFGKTSFIHEIFKKLTARNFFVAYIDVFTITSINQFATEIVESLLKNIGLEKAFREVCENDSDIQNHHELKTLMDEFEFLHELKDFKADNYSLLGSCIDFIEQFSVKNKRRLLFVFDEFGDFKKMDDGRLAKIFKSKLKKHLNTSYLFTGSYDLVMTELFEGFNSPFNRLAKKVTFSEINTSLLKNFYKEQFENHHIKVPETYSDFILEFTGGHPYYSQLALQETIICHLINQELPELDVLFERMMHAEKDYLEKTWEEIATSKQNIKTVLALTKGETGVYSSLRNSNVNIYRSLKTLVGNGTLIADDDKNYRLSDPLLNLWIKKNVHKQGIYN